MRIIFASCCDIRKVKKQHVWKFIQDKEPDLLLLLGDNIYNRRPYFDYKTLKEAYIAQTNEPRFARLLRTVPHYLATWDDQDFGFDRSYGAEPEIISDDERQSSKRLFLEYIYKEINVRENDHIYRTHTFDHGKVKVIMLDARYFRQAPGLNATLLGEEQVEWLKRHLNHNGKFTIICSGSTFSYGGATQQSWIDYGNWAAEFRRMMQDTPHPLFLTGDIHTNAFRAHPVIDKLDWLGSYSDWLGRIRSRLFPPFSSSKGPLPVNFFEVVSSSVCRNQDGTTESRNNFGIMDIEDELITINFYGRAHRNRFRVIIDVNEWRVIYRENHPENFYTYIDGPIIEDYGEDDD